MSEPARRQSLPQRFYGGEHERKGAHAPRDVEHLSPSRLEASSTKRSGRHTTGCGHLHRREDHPPTGLRPSAIGGAETLFFPQAFGSDPQILPCHKCSQGSSEVCSHCVPHASPTGRTRCATPAEAMKRASKCRIRSMRSGSGTLSREFCQGACKRVNLCVCAVSVHCRN